MDQLHEELKIPIPDNNTLHQKEDSNPSLLGAGDSGSSMCVVEASESDESPAPSSGSNATTLVNEESEYETCDSALSSERSSVEQNLNQGVEEGKEKKDKNRPKSLVSVDTDSGISTSNSVISLEQNAKNIKDNVNQQKQHGTNISEIQILPISEKLAELDAGNREGESSETEPLQAKAKVTRSRSSSRKASESEGKVVSKPGTASSASHKGEKRLRIEFS